MASVIAADVVGYSRLMQLDEQGTHARFMRLRSEAIDPLIRDKDGRIVKNTGDGFLAMFADARAALEAAIGLQRRVIDLEKDVPIERRINFRMGVNASDVIVEDHDIYGDGVNIAARLQSYAEPGGIVISGALEELIGGTLELTRVDLGDLPLRNLRPVRVLSLRLPETKPGALGELPGGYESRSSIAVLPFRNLGSPDQLYFVEGIVDNIINALATLKDLVVISRGSTLALRRFDIDVRAIGRDLGVRYVLYGSAQRVDNRVRLYTELADCSTGEIVQAKRCDGDLNDIFSLQDVIAIETVKTIAPHLREHEFKRSLRVRAQNMTAYDLVLQAMHQLHDVEAASFARARGLLQRAMVLDPTYAPAYTYAAYWHGYRIGQEWSADFDMDAREAERLSAIAIELDRHDATALAIDAHVRSFIKRDYAAALAGFERALAAGPNSSFAWILSAVAHSCVGNGPNAVVNAQKGLNLSPIDVHVSFAEHVLSQAHFVNGDMDEAVVWGLRSFERNGRLTSNLRILAAAQMAIGDLVGAREIVQQHLRVAPDFRLRTWLSRTPLTGKARQDVAAQLERAGMPV
jgi:TolB-like protein/class 3 adenylate cyclase/tetratricopeptide (TPR) repeat protein